MAHFPPHHLKLLQPLSKRNLTNSYVSNGSDAVLGHDMPTVWASLNGERKNGTLLL